MTHIVQWDKAKKGILFILLRTNVRFSFWRWWCFMSYLAGPKSSPQVIVKALFALEILTYNMWEMMFKSGWGRYCPHICPNYKILFPQWGPDCLEINLNVSLSCVPSIRLAILHHELSRYVCLITEQLFKFLSSWLLCSYQSLFMKHHFGSGRNGNLLNWRLDSSMLYVNFCFSSLASWTFWYVVLRGIPGELQHAGCMSAQLSQKRNK